MSWYREGLRFACTRCGNCCRGAGTVRVSDAEIAALARRLDMADPEFRSAYTRPLRGGERSLREARNRDCIFYAAAEGCRVYEDRPRQCRAWPFWRAVVHSPECWAEEARECPGMNAGPLHDAVTIERTSADDGTSGQLG
ncbi:MAG: YkgJ family cysteine cluster protein [Myxococcota bacterium]|nr:YkgJ family cysteine cluster protein [Myxococcota bacterium]